MGEKGKGRGEKVDGKNEWMVGAALQLFNQLVQQKKRAGIRPAVRRCSRVMPLARTQATSCDEIR